MSGWRRNGADVVSGPPFGRCGFPEVEGIGHDATIYGLLFFSYFAPDGRPGALTFGPEAHTGSSHDRPGEEWGTGFLFDSPGCWRMHLERPVGSGDVRLPVAPA